MRSFFTITSFLLGLTLLGAQPAVHLVQVASGISSPTDIEDANDGSGRLFLVQQDGRVLILKNGSLLAQPFLDIRTLTVGGGERGLLGLAFPPDYAHKQRFYIDYTNLDGDTVIARYRTSSNSDMADPASATILLTIKQPFANHNGGQVRFNPGDGYLYIGMGDGGSGGDPLGNGQNHHTLLGKILRIDVETDPTGPYRVPASNPFVNDSSFLPEIWAYGLRNPWRYSFDRANNDLYIGDVGQGAFEEVDYQPAASPGGQNYGWNIMEGTHCFQSNCSSAGLTSPVWDYSHDDGSCSIIGGFVYRGQGSTSLFGKYVYGDLCSGEIWALQPQQSGRWTNQLLLKASFTISTFGEDQQGELYVADIGQGVIHRITAATAASFTAGSVGNAASYASGLVAGSLVSVFPTGLLDQDLIVGADRIPLPNSLTGVSVTIAGHAAPLYAVADVKGQQQINLQVPFEVAGSQSAAMVVTRYGVSSDPVDVPVLPAQPGVFSANGRDAIVVHNANNTLVTQQSPATAGEILYFYTTGLGPVDHNPGTGNGGPSDPLARTLSLPQVTIGNANCEVFFAGLAPGLVGVYQINIRVPGGLSGSQDLVVTAGGVSSPVTKVRLQ